MNPNNGRTALVRKRAAAPFLAVAETLFWREQGLFPIHFYSNIRTRTQTLHMVSSRADRRGGNERGREETGVQNIFWLKKKKSFITFTHTVAISNCSRQIMAISPYTHQCSWQLLQLPSIDPDGDGWSPARPLLQGETHVRANASGQE